MVASYPGHMGTRPEYEARDDGSLVTPALGVCSK